MNMKSKISLLAILFLLPVFRLYAAEIYVSPEKGKFRVGETIKVELRLSSLELVNAFEIILFYPPEKVRPVAFKNKNSLINLWVQKPAAASAGKIFLTGGKISGFAGNGILAEITFRAEAPGAVSLILSPDSLVLRHDGYGTPEPTIFFGGKLTIK